MPLAAVDHPGVHEAFTSADEAETRFDGGSDVVDERNESKVEDDGAGSVLDNPDKVSQSLDEMLDERMVRIGEMIQSAQHRHFYRCSGVFEAYRTCDGIVLRVIELMVFGAHDDILSSLKHGRNEESQ